MSTENSYSWTMKWLHFRGLIPFPFTNSNKSMKKEQKFRPWEFSEIPIGCRIRLKPDAGLEYNSGLYHKFAMEVLISGRVFIPQNQKWIPCAVLPGYIPFSQDTAWNTRVILVENLFDYYEVFIEDSWQVCGVEITNEELFYNSVVLDSMPGSKNSGNDGARIR